VKQFLKIAAVALTGLAPLTVAGTAQAIDYPTKPITWIAPSSAGGGFDIVSRILSPKLSEVLGQPVVVQNIEGAGATIGAAVAASAAPDGYTILLANANHTAAESLYKSLSYHLLDAFDPIVRFTELQQVFIANPNFEAKTMEELVALAKEKPGEINMAHAGVGSPTFMCSKLLQAEAGIEISDIPYAGGGQALTAVVSGESDVECALYSAAKPFMEDGTVRGLAITSKERASFAPDLPAVSETVPGYEFLGWFGLVVPKGTPLEVREKIRSALVETLADEKVKNALAELGMLPIDQGPEEFGAYLKNEVEQTKALIEKAGIEPQ